MTPEEQEFIDVLNDRQYIVMVRKENWVWDPPQINFEVKNPEKMTFKEANEYINKLYGGKIPSPISDYYFIAHYKQQSNPEQAYTLHIIGIMPRPDIIV